VISDVHFGIKNNSEQYYNLMHREFFKWLDVKYGNKGNSLILLGDILNNRKYTNNLILSKVIDIFDVLGEDFENIYIITGNHDYFYKDSNSGEYINILKKIFKGKKNIHVIDKITIMDEEKLIFIPYNFDSKNLPHGKEYKDYYCFGHFELDKFYSDTPYILPVSYFKDFKYSFSGHYHQPYEDNKHRFMYVGTPFDLMYNPKNNDDDIPRKIIELDGDIVNKIEYTRKQFFTFYLKNDDDFAKFYSSASALKNKDIRLFVENKFRYGLKKNILENFIKSIEKKNMEIIISYFDGNIVDNDGKIDDLGNKISSERINLFDDEDVLKVQYSFIDNKYTEPDVDKFKKFLYNINKRYTEELRN